MYCCTLLYVHSSIAIILMGKRELIALLNLSSWCLVMVERLFLKVPRGCLQFVIVVFPDHTHLLFFTLMMDSYEGCSDMNASSFITFFTYMKRQNAIHFWKELFVAFKMALNIKTHSLYISSNRRLYKSHSCILKFF